MIGKICYRLILAGSIVLIISYSGFADDVGITKTRLLQLNDSTYVLEADITNPLAWAIKAPIFPDRFQVSEPEYINQSGWIIVKVVATSRGKPLSIEDEILLPWARNGADITAQWLDGKIQQGLFLRTIEGIKVPMRFLLPYEKTLFEICVEHFIIGLRHIPFGLIHIMLVSALFFSVASKQIFQFLLFVTFGQAFSLLFADFGITGFPFLYIEILGAILIFLCFSSAVRDQDIKTFFPILFIYGLLHGLAYVGEISALNLPLDQKLPALFMFNIATDIGHYLIALILVAVNKITYFPAPKPVLNYTIAPLSIAILLWLFINNVSTGRENVLQFPDEQLATQYSLPVSQNIQQFANRQTGARQLTNPVMCYISVEPYEVRQEILIQARAAVQFLGVDDRGMGSIPITSLELVKNGILDVFENYNPTKINGKLSEPIITRSDFVTLSPAGVMIRETPVVESLDNGIIGVTLIYDTPELADQIEMQWQLFSDPVGQIEVTTIDPFGGATMLLTPDDYNLNWESRLSGYQVPAMQDISVKKPELPFPSMVLFIIMAVLFFFFSRRGTFKRLKPLLFAVFGLSIVMYPFVRFTIDIPILTQLKPSGEHSEEILDGLLTNVYRAFDVRGEEDVYDRLAMSVMGDQLAEIYLENRQALELENRGGARANVDEVEILNIHKLKKEGINTFLAETSWTVSGSVNHFGHTHYRQNFYHAQIAILIDRDSWKIKNIELIDEERIL